MKSLRILSVLVFATLASCACVQKSNSAHQEQIVQNAIESIVIVHVWNKYLELQGIGTGAIISPDGWIITNRHVVTNAAGQLMPVTVGFHDKSFFSVEEVYVYEEVDLALIKINKKNLPFMKIRHTKPRPGEPCFTIGNPVPYQFVVKEGIIAQTEFDNFYGQDKSYFVVHTATLHGGNSGGPLIDQEGYLIGINTGGYDSAFSYGLSINTGYVIKFIISISEDVFPAEKKKKK